MLKLSPSASALDAKLLQIVDEQVVEPGLLPDPLPVPGDAGQALARLRASQHLGDSLSYKCLRPQAGLAGASEPPLTRSRTGPLLRGTSVWRREQARAVR